jgi:hypothetical protein
MGEMTQCCCGREIDETDKDGWFHTDDGGKRCYPEAEYGTYDHDYVAEPDPDDF